MLNHNSENNYSWAQKYENLRTPRLIALVLVTNIILIVGTKLAVPDLSKTVGNFYFIVLPCIFALLTISLAAKSTPSERKILYLFAAFSGLRAIAEVIWVVYESVLFIDTFPSLADPFWLAGYAFGAIFLFRYLAPVRKTASRSIKIIATIVVLAHLIPTSTSVYLLHPDSNPLEFLVSIAYPIGDAVFLWQVIAGLTLLFNKKHKMFLLLLMGGITGFIASDTLFVFMTDSYEVGNLADVGWLSGYLMLVFAALSYRQLSKDDIESFSGKKTNGMPLETLIKLVIPLITISTIFVVGAVVVSDYLVDAEQGNTTDMFYDTIVIPLTIGIFVAIVFIQNKNLLKFVHMRTADLENERDRLQAEVNDKVESLMRAERLSAIGELSARIAHDLRNPLAIVKSGFEIIQIKDPAITTQTKETLARIDRALIRMTHQIDNVLDYVSLKPLFLQPILLSELLKSSLERIAVPDGVSVVMPKNDFEFKCDPFKMEIVLVNLIVNAIQAMSNKGQIVLHGAENKKDVFLQIQDTGPGIPSELMDKIFDPLFTTRLVGTGLGLPSCKAIVEKHQGNISIYTEKDKGTTFSIRIPKT